MELRRPPDEFRELARRGKLKLLVTRYQELVDQTHERNGESHPETATVLEWLAETYYELGDWPNAIASSQRSLAIWRALPGTPSQPILHCLFDLADSYLMTGDWRQVETTGIEATELFSKLPEDVKLQSRDPIFFQAMIALNRDEFDRAEQILIRVLRHHLRILESHYGGKYNWTDHGLAALFDRLSLVYRKQGKLLAAEKTIRKAMRIHRNGASGKIWVGYARMWRSLGIIQTRQERHAQARASLRKAMRLVRRCREPGHYEVVRTEKLLLAAEAQVQSSENSTLR
jgi:tetratricopeptide (TPR) repeat protein